LQRISKRFVLGTSVALGLGMVAGFAFLVVTLKEELERTRAQVEDLEARSEANQSELDALDDRLGSVGRELVDVKELEERARALLLAEIEKRKERESEVIQEELSSIEARIQALRSAAEEHARLLAAARSSDDVEARYRELMSPTVRVNGRQEVGSGSLLWSRRRDGGVRTYILTAFHIVEDDLEANPAFPLEVDFYENGEPLRTEEATVVAFDELLDLALVEVAGEHVYEHLARLPSRAELEGLSVFTKVYAIGCPLGYPPLPTSGEVTSLDKELDGLHYWMINAPTIFGNSGGGIYDARSRTLIGTLSRISAYKNMIDVAVPHMGLVTPLDEVYGWLDTTDYAFVYADRLAEEAGRTTTLPASTRADGDD